MEELLDLKRRLEQERPADWRELPDIALYMDQIISYLPRQLIVDIAINHDPEAIKMHKANHPNTKH